MEGDGFWWLEEPGRCSRFGGALPQWTDHGGRICDPHHAACWYQQCLHFDARRKKVLYPISSPVLSVFDKRALVAIVRLCWVGTDQLFQKWHFRNVPPTLDRMWQSCVPPLVLRQNTSLIMCSNVAMKLRLRATRRGPRVLRHEIMWQSRWIPFMHSEHNCGTRRCVWRTLANLVTRGLRPWSSKFLAGVRRTVDLPSLVAVPCAVCEL